MWLWNPCINHTVCLKRLENRFLWDISKWTFRGIALLLNHMFCNKWPNVWVWRLELSHPGEDLSSLIPSGPRRAVENQQQADLRELPGRRVYPAVDAGASVCSPLFHKHARQSGWARGKPVAWSAAMIRSAKAQMFRMVRGQLLEEEKVQRAYLNRGSINRLTDLPKCLRVYLLFCCDPPEILPSFSHLPVNVSLANSASNLQKKIKIK